MPEYLSNFKPDQQIITFDNVPTEEEKKEKKKCIKKVNREKKTNANKNTAISKR